MMLWKKTALAVLTGRLLREALRNAGLERRDGVGESQEMHLI